jgi:thiamine pyrophosphate-dependent acetolactate synthase large subunit-like protein
VLVVGSRLNYVLGFGRPPRFSPTAKFARIDIDPQEICCGGRVDIGIVGDAPTRSSMFFRRADLDTTSSAIQPKRLSSCASLRPWCRKQPDGVSRRAQSSALRG